MGEIAGSTPTKSIFRGEDVSSTPMKSIFGLIQICTCVYVGYFGRDRYSIFYRSGFLVVQVAVFRTCNKSSISEKSIAEYLSTTDFQVGSRTLSVNFKEHQTVKINRVLYPVYHKATVEGFQ